MTETSDDKSIWSYQNIASNPCARNKSFKKRILSIYETKLKVKRSSELYRNINIKGTKNCRMQWNSNQLTEYAELKSTNSREMVFQLAFNTENEWWLEPIPQKIILTATCLFKRIGLPDPEKLYDLNPKLLKVTIEDAGHYIWKIMGIWKLPHRSRHLIPGFFHILINGISLVCEKQCILFSIPCWKRCSVIQTKHERWLVSFSIWLENASKYWRLWASKCARIQCLFRYGLSVAGHA